jgi:hypothetical protein
MPEHEIDDTPNDYHPTEWRARPETGPRRQREEVGMNNRLVIATVAFLLLLLQFNNADAAGPYDGEWKGTATPTSDRCKPAAVNFTVEGQVVLGQAKFDGDTSNISGTVTESGAMGATIGFQFLRGQFRGDEFEGTFKSADCQWEAFLRRTGAGRGPESRGDERPEMPITAVT